MEANFYGNISICMSVSCMFTSKIIIIITFCWQCVKISVQLDHQPVNSALNFFSQEIEASTVATGAAVQVHNAFFKDKIKIDHDAKKYSSCGWVPVYFLAHTHILSQVISHASFRRRSQSVSLMLYKKND